MIGRARLESFEKDIAYIRFSIEDTGIGIAPEAIEGFLIPLSKGAPRLLKSMAAQVGTNDFQSFGTADGRKAGGKKSAWRGIGVLFYPSVKIQIPDIWPNCLGEKKIENVSMDWKGKRLLVAEDNKLNMEIAVTLLEMEGFQLETVQNGKAALELYLKKEPLLF